MSSPGKHMPPEEFETLVSLASPWVEGLEQIALRDGIPLDKPQTADARTIGISHPERIRLLQVNEVPLPEDPILLTACETTRAIGPATWALSARYGILIRTDRWGEREAIVHELVHTSQYEKLGGIAHFLKQYLQECMTAGFPRGAMEQEAIITAARICRPE